MLDEARHGQDPAAEEAVGNVEVPVLFVLGHAEEAGGDFQLGRRFLRFVFLFGVGFGAGTGAMRIFFIEIVLCLIFTKIVIFPEKAPFEGLISTRKTVFLTE